MWFKKLKYMGEGQNAEDFRRPSAGVELTPPSQWTKDEGYLPLIYGWRHILDGLPCTQFRDNWWPARHTVLLKSIRQSRVTPKNFDRGNNFFSIYVCTYAAARLRTSGSPSADERWIVCGQSADDPRLVRRPNFSLTKINSFGSNFSSSWNADRNLFLQLHWNETRNPGFWCPFQRTWNARFQSHFFLYWNGKFRVTISVHLFCNMTLGI
jgi:hypothetical protein